MKIIGIALSSLHNEEWFGFYTDFKELVERFGVENLKIVGLFDRFIVLYNKADKLLIVLRKSVYTKEMENADTNRDDLFHGFYDVVKGMQKQPDEAKRKAALRLFNVLRQYRKSILSGNYAEESSAIYNLLQDLGGTYAADVTLLALDEWVTALGEAEKTFLACRAQRTQESVDKPKEALKLIRVQTDTLYKGMAGMFDAQLLADGLGGDFVVDPDELDDTPHEDGGDESHDLCGNIAYNFVIAWNETVKKYRNLLAQRAGRRAKGKEKSGGEAQDKPEGKDGGDSEE
jgi:hypothetical protein